MGWRLIPLCEYYMNSDGVVGIKEKGDKSVEWILGTYQPRVGS